MGSIVRRVRDLADALDLALTFQARYRAGHAGAVLDARGDVVATETHLGPPCAAADAFERTLFAAADVTDAAAAVVVSAVPPDAGVLREADIRLFHRVGDDFADLGVDLLDWIQCDGLVARSMAASVHLDEW